MNTFIPHRSRLLLVALSVFCTLLSIALSRIASATALTAEKPSLHCDFETLTGGTTPCVDEGGNVVTATVLGAPVQVDGRNGDSSTRALQFDGVDDLVKIVDMGSLDGWAALTVEAWVKVAATGEKNVFRLIQPVALNASTFQVTHTAGAAAWRTVSHGGNAAPTNEWYHLAGVFDQRELRIYVNGRLSNVEIIEHESVQGPSSTGAYDDWAIGARILSASTADQWFAGSIDSVSVHDEALDARTILRHAEQATTPPTPIIVPDFATASSDRKAIQDALTDAESNGATVLVPSGTYWLDGALQIGDGVMLRGEGDSILRRAPGFPNGVSPLLRLDGSSDSTVRDLQLWDDFQTGQNAGHAGIWMSDTIRVHIDRVRVAGVGKSVADYGGIHIWLQSMGADDSSHNVIENCRLDDVEHQTSFGIRLETRWKNHISNPPPDGSVHDNVIKNNHLEGFYQGIEIAGPETVDNLIRGNVSMSPLIVGIEADKGARFNLYLDNVVRLARYPVDAVLSGMRDQGFVQCDVGDTYELYAEGNVFRRNTVIDIENGLWAGGILLSRTENGTFEDNVVRDVRSGTSGQAAVVLRRNGEVGDYSISNNLSSNVPLDSAMPPGTPCP